MSSPPDLVGQTFSCLEIQALHLQIFILPPPWTASTSLRSSLLPIRPSVSAPKIPRSTDTDTATTIAIAGATATRTTTTDTSGDGGRATSTMTHGTSTETATSIVPEIVAKNTKTKSWKTSHQRKREMRLSETLG